ncbi:MAG: hypothetical protein AMXMBFR56_72880 [Polyangiaceae bacterium]
MSDCLHCGSWGCTRCSSAAEQLEHVGGEQGLTSLELEHARVRREMHEARQALGEGWLKGGVSLAEAIARKCTALEQLAHSEREACAAAAKGEDTYRLQVAGSGMSDWREGYLRGRLDAEKAIRARRRAS